MTRHLSIVPDLDEPALTVLDGGMGKLLHRMGAPFRQPEWSALTLMEAPDQVLDAHRAFVRAGAQVLTTSTYAVVPYHLGVDRFWEHGTQLADLAAQLARQAADEAPHPVRVVGSLPPLFGSYEPDRFQPQAAPAIYQLLVDAQRNYVDGWLGETVSSIAEAQAVVAAAGETELDLWLSYCLHNDPPESGPTIVSGETVAAAAAAVADDVAAILFNCCRVEVVAAALLELRQGLKAEHDHIRIGAYANAFEDEHDESYAANEVILRHRADLTPANYAEVGRSWVEAGATIVGGCCGIHPEHIEALADALG
ncbi:MAG: homocysteine S-methyltransferase family protein [Acidimicrobiales bacterium]|nr:homocysteine S-methyltransferase family protein [Acidimicrobiales bacterium]